MGFLIQWQEVSDVEISDECRDILRRFKQEPSSVFGQPFLGNLLFLYSDIDAGARTWLTNHALALDSLTGTDVGFAVFSACVRFQPSNIRKEHKPCSNVFGPERYQNGLPAWNIQRLVSDGHIELTGLTETRELAVVNEAVYSFARELGLTAHLPCVVAFDGLPHPEIPWLCIPLRDEFNAQFYRVIQVAVGRLQNHPQAASYRDGIKRLQTLRQQIPEIRERVRTREGLLAEKQRERERLDSRPEPSCSALHRTMLAQCRAALERGHFKEFQQLVDRMNARFAGLSWRVELPKAVPLEELGRNQQTAYKVRQYALRSWPLAGDDVERLTRIYSKHVCALVSDLPKRFALDSPVEMLRIADLLENRSRGQVETIMAAFPQPSEAMLAKDLEVQERRARLQDEIEGHNERLKVSSREVEMEVTKTELQLVETARGILDHSTRPSFCELLRAQCRSLGIPAFSNVEAGDSGEKRVASSFWTSWLPVQKLLEWLFRRSFWTMPVSVAAFGALGDTAFWRRPPTAFASYASEDRDEVLRRIQGMRAWQPGLDIFVDFHSLHPGEQWRCRLVDEISKRDRFLLFWSREASKSEYVALEWRTALERKGLPSITPVPLEPPDQAPPPPELAQLHFNDLYLELLRRAQVVHGLPKPA